MLKYQISFSRLINTEFYQFLNLIAKSALDADPTTSKFKAEYDALFAILARLLAAINREKAFELTAVLEKQDAERDKVISGFINWIDGYANHRKPEKGEAGIILQNYIEIHGTGIAAQNWQAETTILSKIVDDCKKETQLINALTTLAGSDWIDDLEFTNNAFINTYAERNNLMGADKNKESFYDIRKEAIFAYQALVDIISTRYKAAVADKTDLTLLQKCVNEIDAILSNYRQLIKATQPTKKDTPPAK